MQKSLNKKQFANDIVIWYRANKRDLPFRKSRDPYAIFISEMMLQQTQVSTMLPYFERFLTTFPTFKSLAASDFNTVLTLWEGLGYYRRAKYIHETAQMIMDHYDGKFPESLKEIRKLKGVGQYTAGAIHSIAFNQPTPAVDGNVMRVISRITGYDGDIATEQAKKTIESYVESLILYVTPSDFTQGLMEVGALICNKNPHCEACPLTKHCFAYEHNAQQSLPVKKQLKAKIAEHFTVLVVENSQGDYFLKHNPPKGLLANMLAFPQYQTASIHKAVQSFESEQKLVITKPNKLGQVKHVFTHKTWTLDIYHATYQGIDTTDFYSLGKLPSAMSRAHHKIIEHLKKQ